MIDFLDEPLFDPRARYESDVDDLMLLTVERAKALHAKGIVGGEAWCGGSRADRFPDLVRTMGWLSAWDISLVATTGNQQLAGSALLSHGSPAQVAAYRDEIDRMERVYAFAATEIGRGTNLMAIGTQVHYRHEDRSLRIDTPSDDAAKYWIGNSLFSATHAMVLARLVVDGTDEGHHWFRVPLRPAEGASPFPGVRIRRADPKGGLPGNQTGMIHFDHYRITLDALLSGWARIDESGRYVSEFASRERYLRCLGTFSQERIFPVTGAAAVLRRFSAITLRYSTHREASGKRLLGFPHYRERLMPIAAEALALRHLTEHIIEEWTTRYPTEPITLHGRPLHGLTSGAKAHASWAVNTALVELRELCGGHGFHSHNEMVTARVDGEINTTFGGDNNVMCYESIRVSARNSAAQDISSNPPVITEDGLHSCAQGIALLEALAQRLLHRWRDSQRAALCRPHVHASCAVALLRRWTDHTSGEVDRALRQLYTVTCLLSLTDHLVAEDLLDSAGTRGLLAQRAALSDDCADHPTEVLDLLDVPEVLLGVPLAHPDYIHRTVTAARDTEPKLVRERAIGPR
ncbi:acyl-CoA dehydrogenase family protein [Nocardia pseudobrasiliensis]|uniref:Acyl-CoA oxidase n=1 Tax=Nocardia pseudobrasiliensis TaxID=45979 RepID=A0A370IBK4_9NOCA|nr:acyl-CoA dehydrogenase family protein [Nocardia pseudobrasiliensis]RDI68115.1 acyl-CoA oxidase [Nocardia pseudobrasiliensis]